MTDSSSSALAAVSDETPPVLLSASELLRQGMQAHESKQIEEAGRLYLAAVNLEPDNPDALHLLGILHGQFGDDQVAVTLIRRAIELNPQEAMFHNNLGNVLLNLNQVEEAEPCYRQAVQLDTARYDAQNNLAVLLGRRGEIEGAEAEFKKLLKLAPGFTDARENLASMYLRQGRVHDALVQCVTGLVTSPRAVGLRSMLGRAYSTWGFPEESARVYREWLRDEPDDPRPAHYLAALSGEQAPARASDAYVRATFDGFASSFDAKLAELEYRAPDLVGEAVRQALGEAHKTLRVGDLGCGTGLCGQHLVPYAARLQGVDLSRNMLKRAALLDLYDELREAELVAFLLERPLAFDLLVSADTLCYFGDLAEFAAAARASLDDGGLLVFTVEAHDATAATAATADVADKADNVDVADVADVAEVAEVAEVARVMDFVLHNHGRYSHREGYLRQVLVDAGFDAPLLREVVLRQEALMPVVGWLVTARLPAVSQPADSAQEQPQAQPQAQPQPQAKATLHE